MHLTLETDYAIRIVDCITRNQRRMSAKEISSQTHVTLRFALKILRKLVANGIICSYKGTLGGYEIARLPHLINLNEIMEAIEGPFIMNRCMTEDFECLYSNGNVCHYHNHFIRISESVRQQLQEITIENIIEKHSSSL